MGGKLREAGWPAAGRDEWAIAAIDKICREVSDATACEIVLVAYNRAGNTRIVAGHGIESRYRNYEFDLKKARVDTRKFAQDRHAADNPQHRNMGSPHGLEVCRFFARAPISVTEKHSAALVLMSGRERENLPKGTVTLVKDAAKLIGAELADFLPLLDDDDSNVSVLLSLPALEGEVRTAKKMVALLDEKQRMRAISAPLADLLNSDETQLVGVPAQDVAPQFSATLKAFFDHALATGISPPPFELVAEGREGHMQVVAVTATPFSPTDTHDNFLMVTLRDVTDLHRRNADIERRAARNSTSASTEPSLKFLIDTLVVRRVVRERNSVSYLTLMNWRQHVRKYQIAALKALKQNVPPEMGEIVAGQIAAEIDRLLGFAAFKVIVPMPCSKSGKDSCLSLEIARGLGKISGLPVVQCLRLPPGGGASHPKKNIRRPKIELVEKTIGPALLVDDVASSGAHIEEAVKLLRPVCGSVLAAVWIGGNAS